MRLVEDSWTMLVGATSNWTVLITSFVIGAVAQAHMAMFAFLAFLPWLWAQVLGGGLVLALLIAGPTIAARITHQPKLRERVARRRKETKRRAAVKAIREEMEALRRADTL